MPAERVKNVKGGVDVSASGETVVEVADPAVGDLEVKVVGAAGQALPDAQIDIRGPLALGGRSAGDGTASFEQIPPGKYEVDVFHDGFERKAVPVDVAPLKAKAPAQSNIVGQQATPGATNLNVGLKLTLPGARVIPNAGPIGNLIAVPQTWQTTDKREMRIWFPNSAINTDSSKVVKVPLVIFLHGEIGNNAVRDGQMLATPAEFPLWTWAINVANAVSPFIDSGTVRPLVIAAPSETIANRQPNAGLLFKTVKLFEIVSLVSAALTDPGIVIDDDNVTVVGWSGAGGTKNTGLMKFGGDDGGEFAHLGQIHQLFMIGIADARNDNDVLSKAIQAGLKKAGNGKTLVYSLQKDNGGWQLPGTFPPSVVEPFANAFDAKTDFGRPLASSAEQADEETFDFYRVDDKANPKRIVTRVRGGRFRAAAVKPGLYKQTALFHQRKAHLHAGVDTHPGVAGDDLPEAAKPPEHRMPPLLWAFYVLQRFFRP